MQLNFGTYCMYKKMIYNVKRGPICQNILKKNKSHPKLIPWFSDPHESYSGIKTSRFRTTI